VSNVLTCLCGVYTVHHEASTLRFDNEDGSGLSEILCDVL